VKSMIAAQWCTVAGDLCQEHFFGVYNVQWLMDGDSGDYDQYGKNMKHSNEDKAHGMI